VGCVALGLLHVLHYWPEVIDDAYIVLRYARNFLGGSGWVFSPGDPPVEGFSTPSWLLLSIALLKAGAPDPLFGLKVAGALIHAVTVAGVWLLAGGARPAGHGTALLASLLFAASPFAAYHAVSGLETPLYTGLLVVASLGLLGLAERPGLAFPALALGMAAFTWTRPEAFGYVGALLGSGWLNHRGDARARRLLVWAAVVVVASYGAQTAWRWAAFGDLMPNTVTAKSMGPSGRESLSAGLHYAGRFFHPLFLPVDLVVYVLAAATLARRGDRRDALLAVPVLCAFAFSIAVRGDWMHSFRFLVPAIPFVSVLVARAAFVAPTLRRGPASAAWRPALAVAMAALLGLFALQQAMANMVRVGGASFGRTWKPAAWVLQVPSRVRQGFDARLAGVTRWSLEHVSPRHVVATGDIGFPAWTADERIVDLAGLTDRALARIVPAQDTRAYEAYLRRRAPDVVVFRVERGRAAAPYDALTAASGVLAGLVLADSVGTYGHDARALIYRRPDRSLETSPDSVLARYDSAIRWNPRVRALRTWRDEYRRALAASRRPS
jgi:hypothetical protein